jgi:hypothetical protein
MKNDLLGECNDQKIPENEFTSVFCKRCKNKSCDRAGWASSSWEERISTQASRFLHNPNIVAQNESSRWEGIVDFELFQAPTTTEVWGVVPQTKVEKEPVKVDVVSEERQGTRDDSETHHVVISSELPSEPVSDIPNSATEPLVQPQIEPVSNEPPVPKAFTRQMNTAPQEIIIGGLDPAPVPQPKKPVDEWAVPPKKLQVGGTFKMGK